MLHLRLGLFHRSLLNIHSARYYSAFKTLSLLVSSMVLKKIVMRFRHGKTMLLPGCSLLLSSIRHLIILCLFYTSGMLSRSLIYNICNNV